MKFPSPSEGKTKRAHISTFLVSTRQNTKISIQSNCNVFFSREAVFSSRQVFVFRDKYNSFSVECAKGIIISQLFFLSLVISVLGVEV